MRYSKVHAGLCTRRGPSASFVITPRTRLAVLVVARYPGRKIQAQGPRGFRFGRGSDQVGLMSFCPSFDLDRLASAADAAASFSLIITQ